MRHAKAHRKFGRTASHRRAMLRNMATSLLELGQIETTVSKAKDLRGVVEKLITLAGEDSLHNRRQAYSYLQSKPVVQQLFSEIGPKFKTRPGGYTRVLRTRVRAGDATEMAVIQLVNEEYKPKQKKTRKTAAKTEKKAKAAEEAKTEAVVADTAAEEVKAEAPATEE